MEKKWKNCIFLWKTCTFYQVLVAKKNKFFYKRKLWVIPVKTSRVWIFYDKNSILWLLAKIFAQKPIFLKNKSHFFDFLPKNPKKSKKWDFKKNQLFGRKISREATESSFHRKNSYTACLDRNCPKFSFIQKLNFFRNQNLGKKVHVFHRKIPFFHFFFIWYGADSKFQPISIAKFLAQKKKSEKN